MANPKKWSCRWWDGCMDCCRNVNTHPNTHTCNFNGQLVQIHLEPGCKYGKNCGYEKHDKEHPMWNVRNEHEC